MAQTDNNNPAVGVPFNQGGFFPEDGNGSGIRVMFVGNSMTRHSRWLGQWGMAASARERDYVHLLEEKIRAIQPDAAFGMCQVPVWEWNYLNGGSVLERFAAARDFRADIIVMRCVENCPREDFNSAVFRDSYQELIDYLNPTGNAKIVLTTSFWPHDADADIAAVAAARHYPLVELGDLGVREDMMALGMSENKSVARHPGDLGMATIAGRIWEAIRPWVSGETAEK